MQKKKGKNYIDIFPDSPLDRIFNDLNEYPNLEYDPFKHGGEWNAITKKIGKCTHIYTTSNRWQRKNFVVIPKGTTLDIKTMRTKKRVFFHHKKK
jgi:hypothetical protein